MSTAARQWAGVDSHVHLGSFSDPVAELETSLATGVRLVVSTEHPSEYRRLRTGLPRPEGVQLGLGFHPLHAGGTNEPEELEILREEFASTRWISEIGLDGFFAANEGPAMSAQLRLLESILEFGVGDKILSVHSRDAEDLTAERVLAATPGAAIFHWYDGSVAQAARLVDAGYYFSVNAFMLASATHRELLRWLPRDVILMETDGPTTTMADGRGTHPADVLELADLLARVRGDDPGQLRSQLVANADRLEASL